MNKTKKIIQSVYWFLMILLVIIAILSALSVLGLPQNFRAFVVQSGSMTPSIKVGSIVFIKPFPQYVNGDVITFMVGQDADIKNPKATITHRVVDITKKDNKTFFITKGDANDAPDMAPRSSELVLGKVIFNIPYIGYPVGFIKTQAGFIILIIVPATIIIYSELLVIKSEILKLVKQRKKDKYGKKIA